MIISKVENLVPAEADDGLEHTLELHGPNGLVYTGPLPHMARSNAIGLLMRETSLADARRRGYKPTSRTTKTSLAPTDSGDGER